MLETRWRGLPVVLLLAVAACGGSGEEADGRAGSGGAGGSGGTGGSGGSVAEICDNGADDDRDGSIDCADDDCVGDAACVEVCDNGRDDDLDGKLDCADPDCAADAACLETRCDDGADDDGDGAIDCADYDCRASCDLPACADGDLGNTFPLQIAGSFDGADDSSTASCSVEAPDRTYLWTAPADGVYRFVADGNTIVAVYGVDREDACAGFEIGCMHGPDSHVVTEVMGGDTVRIVLDNANGGPFHFAIASPLDTEDPFCGNGQDDDGDGLSDCADDDCAGSDACVAACVSEGDLLDQLPVQLVADTYFRGNDVASSCSEGAGNDIGWTWTAPVAGRYVIQAVSTRIDLSLFVFDGGDCSGTELACETSTQHGTDPDASWVATSILELEQGQRISVIVADETGMDGDFQLTIAAAADSEAGLCDDGLDNDGNALADCADPACADEYACVFFCVNEVLGAAASVDTTGNNWGRASNLQPSCGADPASEMVFEWTAPAAGYYVIDTSGSSHDTILSVLEYSCSPTQEITCNDDFGTSLSSRVFVRAEANESFLIAVDAYADYSEYTSASYGGDFQLHIALAPARETNCADRIDDDGDGKIDCADNVDCIGTPACTPGTIEGGPLCNDGRDNDGNGTFDCGDPGCISAPNCAPSAGVDQFLGMASPVSYGDTLVSVSDDFVPSCGDTSWAAPDRAYEWVAPSSGVYAFEAGAQNVLEIFDGGIRGHVMGCNASWGPDGTARVVVKVRAGQKLGLIVNANKQEGVAPFTLTGTRR